MTSYPLAAAYIFFSFHLSGVSAPFYSNIALSSWGSTMSIFEHCKHPSAVAWVTADTQTVQPPSRRETWMFLRLLGEQPHSAEHHQWNECARGRPASCCPLLASQSAGRIELSWKGDFGPLQGYRIKLWSCVHATCSEDLQVPDCCPDTCGEPQVSPRHTPTTQIWENTSSTGFFWVEGGLIYRYRDKRIEPLFDHHHPGCCSALRRSFAPLILRLVGRITSKGNILCETSLISSAKTLWSLTLEKMQQSSKLL